MAESEPLDLTADVVVRLRGYADAEEALGQYTEAKCLREAADEIKRLRWDAKVNHLEHAVERNVARATLKKLAEIARS
jgi:hypothetical protein